MRHILAFESKNARILRFLRLAQSSAAD